ncbi:MAG: CDP-diacylglycerol--glycerol-3-phosphate 3-phosphatidyltransferase [Phycisphaerae bacterium]
MHLTIPNWITLARFVLAIAFFFVIAQFDAKSAEASRWAVQWGLWLFVAAAISDFLDGMLARKLNQITIFGRVIDPVADKLLICGAFVFFAGANFHQAGENVTFVAPWMVVVILARELLVTSIRAHAEKSGVDFSASWSGKIKMFLQCAAAIGILAYLAFDWQAIATLVNVLVWAAVAVTAYSAVTYVGRAKSFLFDSGGVAPTVASTSSREPDSSEKPSGSAQFSASSRHGATS